MPRAMAEGLPIDFKVADAEALPFANNSFDTVVSTFGVMFTPNQEQAAAELLRVCKSGGPVANKLDTRRLHRTAFQNPRQILTAAAGREIPHALGHARAYRPNYSEQGASLIKIEPREFKFRYRSAEHFVDVFRTYYGPTLKAFSALDVLNKFGWRRICTFSSGA